uniref:Uncharacterized protein n=1 Tax=Monopterus albus TaxID=43700 RepID=A0A3Q3JSI7_MONAL
MNTDPDDVTAIKKTRLHAITLFVFLVHFSLKYSDTDALQQEVSDLRQKCARLAQENKDLKTKLQRYEPVSENGALEGVVLEGASHLSKRQVASSGENGTLI